MAGESANTVSPTGFEDFNFRPDPELEILRDRFVTSRDSHEIFSPQAIDELVDYVISNYKPEKRTPWRGEYEDNARTMLFESLSAKGHLSRVEFTGDPKEIHEMILQRLINGLHAPCLHPHEYKRRKAEIREEIVIWLVQERVRTGQLPPDTEVLTDSTFPDSEVMTDEEAENMGYRPKNRKGMLRSVGFKFKPSGKVCRVLEQLSYSNSSSKASLARRGITGGDVVSIGRPSIYSRSDVPGGVVDVMKKMDLAGYICGEKPDKDEVAVSYENIRAVSAHREEMIDLFTKELADYERAIDAPSSLLSRQDYYNKTKEIVRRICTAFPEYTADALGQQVVDTYKRAHNKVAAGDFAGATESIAETAHLESEIVACGGSSNISQQDKQQLANMSEREKADFINKLKQDAEKLKWAAGQCRILKCPSAGKTVKVAQCHVCESCQAIFDAGDDPEKIYAEAERERAKLEMHKVSTEKSRRVGKKIMSSVKRFIWGDGAFAPVEKVIGWRGEIISEGKAAEQTYRDYYGLGS